MVELILVGTLHTMSSSEHLDLQAYVKSLSPSHLLLEITESDLRATRLDDYPGEMVHLAKWAQQIALPVFGFDLGISTLRPGQGALENRRAIEAQLAYLDGKNWRDANRVEIRRELNRIAIPLIDPQADLERNRGITKQIGLALPERGRVVVVTGCGHLDYLQSEFPRAWIPLES